MAEKESPQVLVCVHDLAVLNEVRLWLGPGGREVVGHLLGKACPDNLRGFRVLIVEDDPNGDTSLQLCREVRERLVDDFLPIIYLAREEQSRRAAYEAGVDVCLTRPLSSAVVLGQVQALLRIKERHDRLAEKAAETNRINKKLQQAYQQIDAELELAQRIQKSLLPQSLPAVPGVRFAVQYLLCGRVGGDFYDAFRLDENHVGFYVADAMGHGVPASFLTVFVKKGVKAKEVFGKEYRLVPPGEVLARLNRELVEQKLSESPFITMAYSLFNHTEGTIRVARAGHPYPLHIPAEGECRFWQQHGLLLGVVDAEYPDTGYQLQVGDKVLLYSDGIDHARFGEHPSGSESLRACADHHRNLPADLFVQRLARDLFGTSKLTDDVTLLVLERTGR
jgi:sigma-B regulation protein RsbU (phosphoserine phosphatase)